MDEARRGNPPGFVGRGDQVGAGSASSGRSPSRPSACQRGLYRARKPAKNDMPSPTWKRALRGFLAAKSEGPSSSARSCDAGSRRLRRNDVVSDSVKTSVLWERRGPDRPAAMKPFPADRLCRLPQLLLHQAHPIAPRPASGLIVEIVIGRVDIGTSRRRRRRADEDEAARPRLQHEGKSSEPSCGGASPTPCPRRPARFAAAAEMSVCSAWLTSGGIAALVIDRGRAAESSPRSPGRFRSCASR